MGIHLTCLQQERLPGIGVQSVLLLDMQEHHLCIVCLCVDRGFQKDIHILLVDTFVVDQRLQHPGMIARHNRCERFRAVPLQQTDCTRTPELLDVIDPRLAGLVR